MFIDTHCHLFKEYYEDIDEIINNAKESKINKLVVASYNEDSAHEVIDLIKKYDNVYGCIGLHPENIDENFDYSIFENLPNKIVAIGEIGLDYYYTKENKEKQKSILRKQLEIAEKLNMPVVIHSRESTQDTIDILKDYKVKGVIHAFSGSLETAKIYLKMGYKLGINGVVTFKNSNLKDVLKELSPNDIVLETDSPYLTPVPYRGQRNEPARVLDIAMYLCTIYNIDLYELSDITNKNVKELYNI